MTLLPKPRGKIIECNFFVLENNIDVKSSRQKNEGQLISPISEMVNPIFKKFKTTHIHKKLNVIIRTKEISCNT